MKESYELIIKITNDYKKYSITKEIGEV